MWEDKSQDEDRTMPNMEKKHNIPEKMLHCFFYEGMNPFKDIYFYIKFFLLKAIQW